MCFEDLQQRLIATLKARLRNGEMTERRLARVTGISQPHVHNVLKGARVLSLEVADQILRRLGISIPDLLTERELQEAISSQYYPRGGRQEVPVLDGRLGPGLPLPRIASRIERYPFPGSYLTPLERPLVARLARDEKMAGVFRENDLVLLDHSRHNRILPEPAGLYVVSRLGEGIVRRLRVHNDCLQLATEDFTGQRIWEQEMPLATHHILDLVQAKVVWIGRDLLAAAG